jgi:hypothetical protein
MNLNQYIKDRVQNILNERLIQKAQSNINNNIDNASQNIVWYKYRTENIYNAIYTLIKYNIAEEYDRIYNHDDATIYIQILNSSGINDALDYQKKHKALNDWKYKSLVHDKKLIEINDEVRHALKTLEQIVKPITNNDPNWINHILITIHATYSCTIKTYHNRVTNYCDCDVEVERDIDNMTFEIWRDVDNQSGLLERIDLTELEEPKPSYRTNIPLADIFDEKFFDEQEAIDAWISY